MLEGALKEMAPFEAATTDVAHAERLLLCYDLMYGKGLPRTGVHRRGGARGGAQDAALVLGAARRGEGEPAGVARRRRLRGGGAAGAAAVRARQHAARERARRGRLPAQPSAGAASSRARGRTCRASRHSGSTPTCAGCSSSRRAPSSTSTSSSSRRRSCCRTRRRAWRPPRSRRPPARSSSTCAAPGNKTTQLAALAKPGGVVHALERDEGARARCSAAPSS